MNGLHSAFSTSKYKNDDFCIVIWNVLSLYGAGTLKQVKTEWKKYRIDISTVKEIRWRVVQSWIQGTSY
jgi:hypothetical protein